MGLLAIAAHDRGGAGFACGRGGFTIVQKRLERGTFTFPERVKSGATKVELEAHELSMLLEGIEVGRASPRWEPQPRR